MAYKDYSENVVIVICCSFVKGWLFFCSGVVYFLDVCCQGEGLASPYYIRVPSRASVLGTFRRNCICKSGLELFKWVDFRCWFKFQDDSTQTPLLSVEINLMFYERLTTAWRAIFLHIHPHEIFSLTSYLLIQNTRTKSNSGCHLRRWLTQSRGNFYYH